MPFFGQDKTKTAMTNKAPAEERLLAWPDSYYNEREPALRKAMLDLALEKGLSPEEDKIREILFEIRYPEFGKKTAEVTKDTYLGAWITFRYIGTSAGGFFSKKRDLKEVRQEMKNIGFDRMEAFGQKGSDLLMLELRHLGVLYFNLCREDKQYGSFLLGLGRVSDTSIAGKAAAEAYAVAYTLPEKVGLVEELKPLTRAVGDAYRSVFPDSSDLDSLISEKSGN